MDIGRSSFVRATIEELERQVSASGPNATSDEQALILGPLFAVDAGSYHTTGFVMFSTIFADDATRMVILAACLFEYVGARATGVSVRRCVRMGIAVPKGVCHRDTVRVCDCRGRGRLCNPSTDLATVQGKSPDVSVVISDHTGSMSASFGDCNMTA